MENNWKQLKKKIYFEDGSLRDIYIKNTDVEDWKNLVTLVNAEFKLDWDKNGVVKSKIDFEQVKEYWRGDSDLCSVAKIYINNIQVNTHFFDDSEIEMDIDPKEFKTIEDHNIFVDYLKLVSKVCNKIVFVTEENSPENILVEVITHQSM